MTFSVPRDGGLFITDISERCASLIDVGIWEGITRTQLAAWLTNFETDAEKYFAACVLDTLIFRSEAQTNALLQQWFQRTLPFAARHLGLSGANEPDWTFALRKGGADPRVRLVPVVREDDPPTKSAHHVLRLMKRNFQVDENWISYARHLSSGLPPGLEAIIFVDDFLATGDQFHEFFETESLPLLANHVKMAYLPLVGYVDGINKLGSQYSGLIVRSVEVLNASNRLFHTECECFSDGSNTASDAADFYYDLIARRGISLAGNERRGHGGLELAYSFAHASPDNCLPILWWDQAPSWKPLFNR